MGQRARIARQSSSPPMPGSITSSTTRCGDSRSTSAVTSRPSPVVTTRKPSRARYWPTTSLTVGSSSTTSTVRAASTPPLWRAAHYEAVNSQAARERFPEPPLNRR